MLVDDDSDDTFLFEDVLLGIEPSAHFNSAVNGLDALNKIRVGSTLPDVIFLDLNMPGMDGKECLAQLKKDNDLKNIPVIIYTTSSLSKDIELTMQMGAAGFITKPDNMKELKSILSSIVAGMKHNNLQKALQTLSFSSTTFIVC